MEGNIYFTAVIVLMGFAVLDLIVGVSNDAVNFLNSSIGSKVAPRHVILTVAALGILAGVMFSSGMMEVARKGIFHPQYFTMPDLMILFLAVMLADVLILDLFNTFGLPTSTTVSIVFELLGAAVAVSLLKINQTGESIFTLGQYINTAKALVIIGGIFFSIAVAFVLGAVVQFATRFVFTFDYDKTLKRYGSIWGGIALSAIILFILIKGAKGASFLTAESALWIKSHGMLICGASFAVSAATLQILSSVFKIDILKFIVLAGTFALALAFAANDLVNFIGVPVAGLNAYSVAYTTPSPLSVPMTALAGKVPSSTLLLLAAGAVMVATLFLSKRAKTVTDTSINLSSQEEGNEQFESVVLSRVIVRMVNSFLGIARNFVPRSFRKIVKKRFDRSTVDERLERENLPSFDLLRASVNLVAASVVISYATSHKLPLSTTYVTFMVAMGTSFADQAWGSETAVYRVTGVLTVIGGWFMTALAASLTAALFSVVLYFGGVGGAALLMILAGYSLWRTHYAHKKMVESQEEEMVFNLKKITDAPSAISTTFQQSGFFAKQIRESLNEALEGLFTEDLVVLRKHKRFKKKLIHWSDVIVANVFKAMRLLQRSNLSQSGEYTQTISSLQALAQGYADIISRSYGHVSRNHKGLLSVQIAEIREVKDCLNQILVEVEKILSSEQPKELQHVTALCSRLEGLVEEFSEKQTVRIVNRSSKTRLSILYYAIMGSMVRIAKECVRMLEIFNSSFTYDQQKLSA